MFLIQFNVCLESMSVVCLKESLKDNSKSYYSEAGLIFHSFNHHFSQF